MINDILRTNKKVFAKSIKAFGENPALMLVGGFYLLIVLLTVQMVPMLGFLAGLISVLIQSALISNYLYLMNRIIFYGKFDKDDFKAGFLAYFRMIWVVYLVFWVSMYALSLLLMPLSAILGSLSYFVMLGFWFVFIVALNALPETIYQKNLIELDTFKYSFEFIKTNPVEWFVPNIILFGITYFIYEFAISIIDKLVKGLPIDLQISLYWVILIIIFQILIGFIMLYRGFLFKILSTTTRRKRYFMRDPNER